jgi:hypothetical protein
LLTPSIVAIPGLGANPEWTWKRDKVHWLRDDHMLPRRVQNARISVFQYQSQWFGKGAVDQRLQHVADQLLYFLELLRGVSSLREQEARVHAANMILSIKTRPPLSS